MHRMLIAALVGCTSAGTGHVPMDTPPPDTVDPPPDPTDSATDTGTDTATDTVTDTGGSTGPCAPDGAMSILDAAVEAGPRSNQFEIAVELSLPGSVAVVCTADADPDEQHLVEGRDQVAVHSLRFEGLRPFTAYTCEVAPTCPTMLDPVASLPLQSGPAPANIPLARVDVNPALGMTGAWTVMNKPIGGDNFQVVIYDDAGIPRWWYELPSDLWDVEALYHPEDHSVVWGGGDSPEGRARVVHLWDGETYSSDLANWQGRFFHHDAKRIADGRMLTLETEENTAGNDTWEGFRVVLHDPATGAVDFEAGSQRYVDEGLLRTAGGFFDQDPYHANWMDWRETARGPELYISLCFDHQLIAIDGTNGDMLWQFGEGQGWTLTDEAGAPLGEDALPNCQHGVEVDGDNFLFYDNGQDRGSSQGIEWHIDGVAKTAQRLWSWTEPGWNEDFLGDIDYLDGDRVLITEARFGTWFGNTEIVEVDRATGQVASRMTFDSDGGGYRAERYDGCEIFNSVAHCPDLADRWLELQPLFDAP